MQPSELVDTQTLKEQSERQGDTDRLTDKCLIKVKSNIVDNRYTCDVTYTELTNNKPSLDA